MVNGSTFTNQDKLNLKEVCYDFPEGEWKWYYRSGTIREQGSFKGGKRVGLWKQFDVSGNVIEEKEVFRIRFTQH